MTKHYTELTGALGERIQFGAQRHVAEKLFHKAPPLVRICGKEFVLNEISALGFSVVSSQNIDVPDGVESVEVWFEQGDAVLSTSEILRPGHSIDGVVECRFFDRAIDLEALAHDNASAVATARVTKPRIDRVEVPTEYKIFCADLLDSLASYRREIEEELAPFDGALTEAERAALDNEMEGAVRKHWGEFILRGNALVLPFKNNDPMRAKLKRYTENLVTNELCRASLQRRCYEKPMGYPGDFQIMNMFYDHRPEGDGPYERFLYLLGLIAGAPIAGRMRSLTHELEALAAGKPDQEHFHIMSVGSGPAREYKDFFEGDGHRGKGYSLTLVDPEAQALDFAIRSIYSSVRTGVSSIMVSGMNTSFTEMLRPGSTFRHLPPQDFIYSAGLTDYLNTKLTRMMVKKLYEHVRPGGTVLIGNVNDSPTGMYWSAEYALDWTMYFRNEEEMMEIADGLPGVTELTLDESGAYWILKTTKPA